MKVYAYLIILGGWFCLASSNVFADTIDSEQTKSIDEVLVIGETIEEGFEKTVLDPRVCPAKSNRDTTTLLRGVPGANYNYNGSFAAQAQYRGLYGPRINVAIDDKNFNPSCPNWMDPPLHYVSQSNLDSLEMVRGIAPVSSGIETFGTTMVAYSKKSKFTDSRHAKIHGSLDVGGASAQAGFSAGTFVSVANHKHRAHFSASTDIGNDLKIPDGTLVQTRYEQFNYGGGYGLRLDEHEFGFDYNRSETDEAGTPALPMDNVFSNMDSFEGNHQWSLQDALIKTNVYYSEMEHRMDNFTMRQAPIPSRHRINNTESSSGGGGIALEKTIAQGNINVGVDVLLQQNDAQITNPNNSTFLVDPFNETSDDKYSVFSEWKGELVDNLNLILGVRFTHAITDAKEVTGPSAPPAVRLADAFNAASRKKKDDNIDWQIELTHTLSETVEWELGFARKTRSPSYLERYAWIPLDASAGLSDGNNYVGDINLDPEVSHQVELGINWNMGMFQFTPRGYYRQIDDYIQGTPAQNTDVIAVSTGSGDSTPLAFSNVDAELYGVDFGWRADISKNWFLDGSFSYVRGKRRDINDNLYRVSPANGTVGLTYQQSKWNATLQGVFAAKQEDVSVTNGELNTAGYGIMNLSGNYQVRDGFTISAGIENVFDKFYRDHLSGINRVNGSDIDVGLKLPGAGRNYYLSCRFDW